MNALTSHVAFVLSRGVIVNYCLRLTSNRPHDDGQSVFLRDRERVPLHQLASPVRHVERRVVVDRGQVSRVRITARIARKVPRHVLDELTDVRAESCGEPDRRQVGTTTTQRHDAVATAAREKARSDDHVVIGKQTPQPQRPKTGRSIRWAGFVDQSGLVHIGGSGSDPSRL